MKRAVSRVCLITVLAVVFGVISQGGALAVVSPAVSLGQVKDDLIVSSRIAVDGAGSLYVADTRRQNVVKYDQYRSRVAVYDQISPDGRGLAVSADGRTLYSSVNTQVEILNTETGFVSYLGGPAFRFVRVADIGLDNDGYVYVADAGDFAIKVFAPNGSMIRRIGSKGDLPGQFQGINGMTIDAVNKKIYVADSVYTNSSKPEVLVFSVTGAFQASYPGETGFGTAKLSYFNGLVVQTSKTVDGVTTDLPVPRLYVFDGFRSFMYGYEIGATALSGEYSYKSVGYSEGELSNPQDAVYDPVTGRLFVACNNGRVEIFGLDGAGNPVNRNEIPGVPVPVSPSAESVVTAAGPTLRFQNAVDADVADVLTYDVAIYAESDLVNPVATVNGASEGALFTEVTLTSTGIVENARHAWAVRAYDGTDYSDWSAPQYFWMNAVPEAPSVPAAIAPDSVATILDGAGIISWGASSDPDPGAVVSYELELSADADFATVATLEALDGQSLTLAALADYDQLLVGSDYFWRVTAVDEVGERSAPSAVGAFHYDTSVLYVNSPLSGTRVYLGGDQAYPGQFLGETPLALRDFAAGKTTIVAEYPGFEPYVTPVEVNVLSKAVVEAVLVPAIAPDDFKQRAVEAAGAKITLPLGAAPVLADLDGDGFSDLLVVDASGVATRYLFDGETFQAGTVLPLSNSISAASPFVVDWNNDGAQDLLVGGLDSLNIYDGLAGSADVIQDVTTLLAGDTDYAPVVADLNGDGAKDLLVGTSAGQVYQLLNSARNGETAPDDAAPYFVARRPLLKTALAGPVAPVWVDWDADGVRDLVVAAQGAVYLCAADSDGYYAPVQVVTVKTQAVRKADGKGKNVASQETVALGERLRVVVSDIDAKGGKDIVVGTAAGELIALVANGSTNVVSYPQALLEKISELEGAGVAVVELTASIEAGKYGQAKDRVEAMLLDAALNEAQLALLTELLLLLG